jgi:hypothetical protein
MAAPGAARRQAFDDPRDAAALKDDETLLVQSGRRSGYSARMVGAADPH